jgi:hypothetical protein
MPALVLVLLALCASVFSACGNAGREEAAVVEDLIVEASMSRDPAGCTRYLTQHYLEQASKQSDEAAVTACEEGAIDPLSELPEKVTVSRVDVDGVSATALVSFRGSAYDGQTVELALAERNGRWKFHEILRFVDLDHEKLVTGIGRELMLELAPGREAEAGACIVGLLEEMSDRALEALLLEASLDEFLALSDRCVEKSESV